MPGAVIRSKHKVRPRPPHFLFRRLFINPRRQMQPRVQRLSRENQKQIIRVRRQRRNQPTGLVDAHVAQRIVATGIRRHAQHPQFHGALHPFFIFIDHHERHARPPQLIGRPAPQPPEAAHDVVPLQFLDHVFNPSLSEILIQLQLDRGLRHRPHGQKNGHHAERDQEGIEDPPRVAQRPDLAVAYRRHGSQRHIERIEDRVTLDQHETDGPQRQREQDRQRDHRQPSR